MGLPIDKILGPILGLFLGGAVGGRYEGNVDRAGLEGYIGMSLGGFLQAYGRGEITREDMAAWPPEMLQANVGRSGDPTAGVPFEMLLDRIDIWNSDRVKSEYPEQLELLINQMASDPSGMTGAWNEREAWVNRDVELNGLPSQRGDSGEGGPTVSHVKTPAELQADLDARIEAENKRLTGYETEGTNFFESNIGRLGGFLEDPSSIRSDAELAGRLTQVENAIDQRLGTIRKTASKQLASSGLRAAGKVGSPVRTAEQLGTFQKGQNISQLLGEVSGEKKRFEEGFLGFQGDVMGARNEIERQGFFDASALSGVGQSFVRPQFTQLGEGIDVGALGQALQAGDVGTMAQILGIALPKQG